MGSLYHEDLVLWAEEQGRALRAAARAGWNAPIDWENVAEEIETLGRSERHALASHIAVVIEHLLKLQVSPATDAARCWRDTIRRARREIQRRLKESPSLRREVANIVLDELAAARSPVLATSRNTANSHAPISTRSTTRKPRPSATGCRKPTDRNVRRERSG
ncbi:MAG TPA: DUF29 domain-containing protein [Acetobacteraceae bacterium]|nr:DUF29 domain-containing protein [Acetobacteraceae bacterium]